jgi:hypothetical protein
MTEINPADYLTIIQAAKKIGCPRRSFYRILGRLSAGEVSVKVFGKTLIKKSAIARLRAEYAPLGSDRRHQFAVEGGRLGGKTKAANAAKR